MNNKYFEELARQLNKAGIHTAPLEQDRLPILWNGEAVIFVSPSAHTYIQTDEPLTIDGKDMYYLAADTARQVHEYVTAVQQAPLLRASGLDSEFHKLAEFNNVVLAGRELPNGFGYQFVTWGWNRERSSLDHGNYYNGFSEAGGIGSYESAKRNFAVRSGLVSQDLIFTPEQLTETYRCVRETLESGYPITAERESLLKDVCAQIQRGVSNLDYRVIQSIEKELAAAQRHTELDSKRPESIEIYWQDLTRAKQSEILQVFGENGNWDVFPIATLDVSEADEIFSGQDQSTSPGMELGGM